MNDLIVIERPKFERETVFTGAYDFRDPDPSRNYGIHCMDLYFRVKGPEGGVSISCFTPWYLPQVQEDRVRMVMKGYPFDPRKEFCQPRFVDVGQHCRTPRYEGQTPMHDCKVTGGDCYSDGSALYGDEWVEGFLHGGSDWLFAKMEDLYMHWFHDGPAPDLTPVVQLNPKDR